MFKMKQSLKIALLLPANLYFCPYAKIYTKILDKAKIDYDIIFWDKDGLNETGGLAFKKKCKNKYNPLIKLILYIQYIFFLRNTIERNKYNKLIVFGPQIGVLLYFFLNKRYRSKFIFDYRDLSIEQIFKKTFVKLLFISNLNIISSPGFLKYLPKQFNYILSHNFDIDTVKKALSKTIRLSTPEKINILTIGGIRDYEANLSIIKALSNKENFYINFVGKGGASVLLKKIVKKKKIKNVSFHGFYKKEKEGEFISECTFLNIFYPKIISHSTALSNRFYNALIFKKPMIVTTQSIQGYYVEKYNLGLSLDDCNNLDVKLKEYLIQFDYDSFCDRCNALLNIFIKDYILFEKSVLDFVNSKSH
jgi:hypothetical protein